MALAGKKIKVIRARSISWQCLPAVTAEHDTFASVDLSDMSELSLDLTEFMVQYVDMQSRPEILSAQSSLNRFLKPVSSNKDFNLELNFGELFDNVIGLCIESLFVVVFTHHWPTLRKLTLQGIAATEVDLFRFLDKHSESLKILHLGHIEITAESNDDEGTAKSERNPGSIVGLFFRIAMLLKLESASISGRFTNRVSEAWSVDTEVNGSACLRRRIELWLSRKGVSPFLVRQLERVRLVEQLSLVSDESWKWDLDTMRTEPEMSDSEMSESEILDSEMSDDEPAVPFRFPSELI